MSTTILEFSQDEIKNFNELFRKLETDLLSRDKYSAFAKNPYQYLLDNGLLVFQRFRDNYKLIQSFNSNFLKLPKLPFKINKCVICKITAMAAIYAVLLALGIPWDSIIQKVDLFINLLDKLLGGTGKLNNSFIERLRRFVAQWNPSDVALEFCQANRFCESGVVWEW